MPVARADSGSAASTLFFLDGFCPSLAAVIVGGMTGGWTALRTWLARCLQWRARWGLMTLAFVSPLAILTLAAAAHMALGGSVRAPPALGHVALSVANFALVFLVGGPLGEEFGRRGFALPAMQERLGWRASSLVLGALWGVWHMPLFLIAGASQHQGSLLAFFVLIVATSVVYTWFFNGQRSTVNGKRAVCHRAAHCIEFLAILCSHPANG